MPQITEGQRLDSSTIMVVDDNAANLKLLEEMLHQQGYEVQSFPRGRLAIAAAENEPPDLILLDIDMPEMDGFEVCERLKSETRLAAIPVIFLSALTDVTDKLKAFRSGGVDYISKPFHFEEVRARVETHLKLRHAQRAEHELLERTLGGAVKALWQLIQLTSPLLAVRSAAIRDIVICITKRGGIKDPWQYELAATLCLVGCIVLPDEVFEKAYCGQDLTEEEQRMFRAHPDRAAALLSGIPRLETVAEIIRTQQRPGNSVLHLALELDRRAYRGANFAAALSELRRSGGFDVGMLNLLEDYTPAPAEFDVQRIPIRLLRAGMVIETDVFSTGDLLILKKGTILTDIWIERLENFARTKGTQGRVSVRVPRPSSLSRE